MVARMPILVPGMAVLSSSNDRPSSKWVTTTSCLPPDLVLITPVAPSLSGPLSRDSFMSGFHSGQVFTSDQTRQTRAGAAFVSSDASRNAISPLPLVFCSRRKGRRSSAHPTAGAFALALAYNPLPDRRDSSLHQRRPRRRGLRGRPAAARLAPPRGGPLAGVRLAGSREPAV